MATVRYFPNDGPPILTALHKPVTTFGRALGNDIHLPDASVAHHHAQIVFNGRDFQLEELDRDGEILINGKKKRRARLATVIASRSVRPSSDSVSSLRYRPPRPRP